MNKQDFPFFNQNWLALQQTYWGNWWKIGQQAFKQAPNSPNPFDVKSWTEALELWWKNVSIASPLQGRDVLQQVVEQTQNYFKFNEILLSNLQNLSYLSDKPEEWQAAWNKTAEQMKEHFSKMTNLWEGFSGGSGHAWGGVPNMFEPSMVNWMKTFTPAQTPLWANGKIVQEAMERLLSIPGIGYHREWQEQIQEAGKLWLVHQRAQEEYFNIFKRLADNMVDRLGEKLKELGESGSPITGLRALYDLWVDSGEDVYAELVSTDEYAQLNAHLTNTLMAWKQQGRKIIDNMAGMFGFPTRQELNTLHQRMQEMRRHARTQPEFSEPDSLQLQQLREEVKSLRLEVETLKKKRPATQSRPASKSRKSPSATGE